MTSNAFTIALVLLHTAPASLHAQAGRPPARQASQPRPAAQPSDSTTDTLGKFVQALNWRLLGPAAMSGRVTSLAVPEPFRKTFYVGTAGGGLWKTGNGGTTWQPVTDKIGVQSIGDVAIAPSDSSIVWIGTGEKNSLRSASWGNGVHKSSDGGRTWQAMGLSSTTSIGRIVIHPGDPNIVYVAAMGHLWGTNPERGVFKTVDGGKTWIKTLFVDDTTGIVSLALDPRDPNVLYAGAWHRLRWGGGHMEGVGAGSGIYKTTDGGTTWRRLNDPALHNGLPSERRLGRIGLAIYPKNPDILYAVIQNNEGVTSAGVSPYGGVFRSADAGASWTQVNDLSAVPFYYYNEIWVDPSDADHVWLNAAPLYHSRDGGKTFASFELTRVHGDFHALWTDPDDSDHLILGGDGGAYVSYDAGKAWDKALIPAGQFYTVAVDTAQQPYYVCGGLQDNGVWCGPSASRDEVGMTDADWYTVNGGDGMHVQVAWHDPNIVYSESQFGNMSRLDLRSWQRVNIRPVAADAGAESGYDLRWGWTAPLVVSRFDSTALYVGSNYLIKLTDKGANWRVLGPDMTRMPRTAPEPETGYTSYRALFAIAESPRNKDILWTGSDDGLVWVTRDGGASWTNVTDRLPRGAPTRCWVASIAPSHHADGTAYLVYDCHRRDDYAPHVFQTADLGQTWQEITANLPASGSSLSILESPRHARLLWVGTEFGVFVTLDGGRRWLPFGSGLPPVGVRMMSMAYAAHDLVAGTFGRGIWVAPVGPLEELTDSLLAGPAHLFAVPPARAFRQADTYAPFGSRPFIAKNPARGTAISYYLRDSAEKDVELIITATPSDTVRKLRGPGYPGLHQVTWDLRRERPRPREKGGPTSQDELRDVLPGDYTVTLKVAGLTLIQPVRVEDGWPRNPVGRLR